LTASIGDHIAKLCILMIVVWAFAC